MMDDLKQKLTFRPWRGPVIPAGPDIPDSMQPIDGRMNRVKVFNPSDPEQALEYEGVLNRISRGLADGTAHQVNALPNGEFRILMAWAELYMCAPDYVPAEGRPVLRRMDTGRVARMATLQEPETGEEEHLQAVIQTWAEQQNANSAEAEKPEEPETFGIPLTYSEDDETASVASPALSTEPAESPAADTNGDDHA